jgi:hypothetical protein
VVVEDCTVKRASWVAHIIVLVDQVELQAEITVGLVAGAAHGLLGRESERERCVRVRKAGTSLTNPWARVWYLDFQQEPARQDWWPVRARQVVEDVAKDSCSERMDTRSDRATAVAVCDLTLLYSYSEFSSQVLLFFFLCPT